MLPRISTRNGIITVSGARRRPWPAFIGQQLGVAAAISVLLLVVVALLSWGALRLFNPMKGEPR